MGAGYLAHNRPGRSIRFTRGEDGALEPGPLIASYLEGELPAESWREVWARAGISGTSFSAATSPADPR